MTQGWVTIDLKGPLDLAASLESGQAFRWRRVEAEGGECFEGVVFGNLVRIRQSGRTLELDSFPDPAVEIRPLIEDYLCVGHDLEAIYEELGSDSRVATAIAAYSGLRIQRQDPWECLTSFICSANNNIARISQNVESIADAFGDPIAGSQRRTFPTPAVVADAGESALRELGLGFRAKYLAPAARKVAEGAIDLYALREMEYAEAALTITELAGVGDKVANCVSQLCDAVLAGQAGSLSGRCLDRPRAARVVLRRQRGQANPANPNAGMGAGPLRPVCRICQPVPLPQPQAARIEKDQVNRTIVCLRIASIATLDTPSCISSATTLLSATSTRDIT